MPDIRCEKCLNIVQPDDLYCQKCGSLLGSKTVTAEPSQSDQTEQGREGLDSVSGARSFKIPTDTTVISKNNLNNLAITSLVLGFLAIIVYISFGPQYPVVCIGPSAIVTGVISLIQIKKQGSKGKGLAIAGIVIGTLTIIFAVLATVLLLLGPVIGDVFNKVNSTIGQ